MRTLLLIGLCALCIGVSVMECHDRSNRGKLVAHVFIGLMMAAVVWWLLAYQFDIFRGYREWRTPPAERVRTG